MSMRGNSLILWLWTMWEGDLDSQAPWGAVGDRSGFVDRVSLQDQGHKGTVRGWSLCCQMFWVPGEVEVTRVQGGPKRGDFSNG